MSYGYGDPLESQKERGKALKCANCSRMGVIRQEDGTYVCSYCGATADINDVFDDIDNFEGQETNIRSFHISKISTFDNGRVNQVILAEAIQLILASQTASASKFLGIDLSPSVFHYLQTLQFSTLIRPPITIRTFSIVPLILLSGILHLGIPCTHIDIIRWIRDGHIPYMHPQNYLPDSFINQMSQAELKQITPNFMNLRKFIWGEGQKLHTRIHPLPNPILVFWRIACLLKLPPRPFSEFCLSLAHDPSLLKLKGFNTIFTSDRTKLFKISSLMRIGFAIPSAIALFALLLIYRLDGTDWIHPDFAALGFSPLVFIMKAALTPSEVIPAFPKLSGDIPVIHSDISKLYEETHPIPIIVTPIIDTTHEGYGKDSMMVFEINSIAGMNSDLRTLLCGISRGLGISQLLIAQQFIHICRIRYGLLVSKRRLHSQ